MELIKAVMQGDENSFRRLVEKYKAMVYNLAFRMLGNASEAEDLAQESFIRAYKGLKGYDFGHEFRSWLYTVTLNACRSKLRRKKLSFFSYDCAFSYGDGERRTDEPGSGKDELENEMSARESEARLRRLIKLLPLKYRTVFILRYIENKSYEEIAKHAHLPLGTVKTYLYRGQKILVEQFKKGVE
ncbi:MAG: sigma-70 family RNA polymerase sigma factor [Endomicrobiales bacterium]|nr:sigma-70 family RNA polymerase sigma factor [Endomicrobiales bacterium]